ncbi:MAG: ABC transporter substrate-binding protein, partial [Candidatus Tectomicrobia bacterium]|nr:ABC transporter substrate-binding protein [Candidatus Tectomicrobia bacterium]
LAGMLEAEEIDALVMAFMPSAFMRGAPHIGRLFPDYRKEEQEYFRQTRIFPIMHTVVLHREFYDQNPWVAQSLYKAFCQSMRLCQEVLYDTNALACTLPWLIAEIEETRDLMGEHFWPYGVEASRLTLETLTQYSYEQGLTSRKWEVDSLFAPNTLSEFKT